MSRQREAPLVDPAADPRKTVGLAVGAGFLKMHPETLRARIEAGLVTAWRDGNIYRISVRSLVRYARSLPGVSDTLSRSS